MVRNPLTICVLGSTFHRAAHLICELVSENPGQIRKCSRLQKSFFGLDGTYYEAASFQVLYQQGVRGVRFDQIFVDPSLLYQPMYKVVRVLELLDNACAGSNVPEEFRFVWLDEERGVKNDVPGRDSQ